MTKDRYQIRHYAPGVDVRETVCYRRQTYRFASARMSKAIKGGVVARFVKR